MTIMYVMSLKCRSCRHQCQALEYIHVEASSEKFASVHVYVCNVYFCCLFYLQANIKIWVLTGDKQGQIHSYVYIYMYVYTCTCISASVCT